MKYLIYTILIICFLGSCGRSIKNTPVEEISDEGDVYQTTDVNAIDQAKPEIMIIPSDGTLKEAGYLRIKRSNGEKYLLRDYARFLVNDEYFKPLAGYIQNLFIGADYPLNDFEQTLKNIDNKKALAIADNLDQDVKTKLLQTTKPDIILEFDYNISSDVTKSNRSNKTANYVLNAIDAYTNKVVASIQGSGIETADGLKTVTDDLNKRMSKFMNSIQNYFNDILTRGREITVRINVDADSNQKLSDNSIEGDTYTDAIIDYVKTHTVKGTYKMQTNTGYELYFTNVRIKLTNEDGTQYGVYDWTRDLRKYLRDNLGIDAENCSQGLGEVVLTIKGI